MKKCILDLDGVLVDFVGGCFKLFNTINPTWSPGVYGVEKVIGVTLDELWEEIDKYGSQFWSNLKWTLDGRQILHMLELYFGRGNIVICTKPSRNPEAASGKVRWIQSNMPGYAKRFLIGPAKEFCAAPNHYMVDDSEINVDKFIAHGGNAFLLPRVWNRNYGKDALTELKKEIRQWMSSV